MGSFVRWRAFVAIPFVLLLSTSSAGASGAGDLDPSFGDGGIVTTTVGVDGSGAFGVAVQPDDKVVAFGQADYATGRTGFAVVRYLEDGQPDPSFGSAGVAETAFGAIDDEALAGLVQPDGKIVAVGRTTYGINPQVSYFAAARYNPDGTLDATFGSGGRVVQAIDADASLTEATAADIAPDGKLVLAGIKSDPVPAKQGLAIVRLNPDGSLDTSFGNGGVVLSNLGDTVSSVGTVQVLADGSLLVAPELNGSTNLTVLRYTPAGVLDSTFGNGGIATQPFPEGGLPARTAALALLPDGDILVGGDRFASTTPAPAYLLAALKPDGTLDTTELSGGSVTIANTTTAPDPRSFLDDVLVQGDGKIDLVGWVGPFGTQQVEVDRLTPDGKLDPSFTCDGSFDQPLPAGQTWPTHAAALDPKGQVVTAGPVRGANGTSDFALSRILGSGSPDCAPSATPTPAPAPAEGKTLHGTAHADRLAGTAHDDVLNGLAGNDILRGGAGNDVLRGGAGNDLLIGGPGRDTMLGGAGNDVIRARDGQRDRVDCGTGRDVVYADRRDVVARDCERVKRS